jgi:hypothetical protein
MHLSRAEMREPLQESLYRDARTGTCPAEMFSSRLAAKIAHLRIRVSMFLAQNLVFRFAN